MHKKINKRNKDQQHAVALGFVRNNSNALLHLAEDSQMPNINIFIFAVRSAMYDLGNN